MAQTGSAQREPSMEEILASIRRIIEDSDTARQPGDDDAAQAAGSVGDEVEAFRAELDEPVASVAQPVSMAEIDASSAHDADAMEVEEEPAPKVPPFQQGEYASTSEAAFQDDSVDVTLDEMDLSATAGDEPPAAEAPGALMKPAILSDQAGRQVAAAFGELSEVFAASRRRSFDEMAEEMLRPMLQDWLDNNLPTLVEKLVREEIERVARGG
jgi:cell pole-organizing protein PopZ